MICIYEAKLMRFETDRLVLREYKYNDFERVHIYGSKPDFSKYEMWGPNSVEDTKYFIDTIIKNTRSQPYPEFKRFEFELAVCLKPKNPLIGGCSFRRLSELSHVARMGWGINPDFQNCGYATEVAQPLINFGFQDLGLRVIYATCDTRNIASYKVMEKLGMQRVGILKGDRKIDGRAFDSYRYEISL